MSSTFNQEESLAILEQARIQVIMAPFYGAMVPVKVRKLTSAQIASCGNMSLIETFEDKIRQKNAKHSLPEIIAYCDRMHNLVRKSLVAPTYQQIMEQFGHDRSVVDAREKLDAMKLKLKDVPISPERSVLEEEIDSMKIWTDLLLPAEFMGTIISWALDIDASDIKEITDKMLLEAAILAERCHNSPADQIPGRFTPFMLTDINRRALQLLDNERKKAG